MIDNGEKLLSLDAIQLRPFNTFRSAKETSQSLVPFATELEKKEIAPYETALLSLPSAHKSTALKKKATIDFSTFNKYLYLKDNEFLYCRRSGNPIDFVECVYSDLMPKRDKKKKLKTKITVEYITMSKNTVMLYQNGNSSIHSLPEWVDFYVKFKKLLQIRLVKNYRLAKLFDLWRKFYKRSMKTLYSEKLKKKFHHIDDSLLGGIVEIRTILKDMATKNIFKLEAREPVTLTRFQESHKTALREIDATVEQYRKAVKRIIERACNTSYQVYKEMKKITLEDNIGSRDKKTQEEMNKLEKKFLAGQDSNFVQNFLKDSMPYAQDATRRTHYKKLLKYIRVMDLMFNEAKYAMIKFSLANLADKVTRLHDCFLHDWQDPPLIIINDLPNKEEVSYIPHMERVQEAFFKEFVQEKIYAIVYRKSFIDPQEFPNYMICFEEVFEVSVDQNSNLNIRIKEDSEIGALFYQIKKNFENCHVALENFTKSLVPVLNNYNSYTSINFKALEEDSHPEQLKELLSKFTEEGKVISQIKLKKNLGIFQIHLGNFLEKVQRMPSKWIAEMREIIPKVLVNKLKTLIGMLNRDLKKLNAPVTNVESFIALKTAVKAILDMKDDFDQKNSDINDILNIIRDDKEIKVPDFDTKYIREKEALFVDFEKRLSDMGYFIENNLAKFKREVKDDINKFDKEIKRMMDELNVSILNNYDEDYYPAMFYIENKSIFIKKFVERKDFFHKQEEAIEMEDTSDFENLDNLEYDYEIKSKLWDSVREFQDQNKSWGPMQVMDIAVEQMEAYVNKWTEIGRVGLVDLEITVVPKVLLEKTSRLAKVIPVLNTFQNPNIHKEEKFVGMIQQILDSETDFKDRGFTFEKLVSLPEIDSHIPKIVELNNRADEEGRLVAIYTEVKENFSIHKIPMNLERSSKPTNSEKSSDKYVIYAADFDQEYEWVEEKIMILKKTLLSRYNEIVKEKVTKLLSECYKYLYFLDEFQTFQRFGNTIDAIFPPDNIKEIPSEFKKHLGESMVKNVTKLLKDYSMLSRFIDNTYQKVFTSLQTINKNYEEFFAYVEDFLENKRKDVLKYYLLSNEELLEVISNFDSNEVKRKYISKLVPEIKTLEFVATETDEFVKVTTVDGESLTVKLSKGKTLKDIIDSFESDVVKKLKHSFRSFRKDYEGSQRNKSTKKPKDVLMDIIKNRDNLGQTIFNFLYSLLIDQLEKALNTDDVFDKMIDIKLESKERRKNFVALLKDKDSTTLDRKILVNQIALEIYFNEIIKNLIREDCNSVADFNWQKVLQIKIDSDSLFIKVFNSTNFEYGYEYVGLHDNFLISPQSEKVYVTIANCFTLKKPFFMYGLAESGKKETMNTMAKIFGKTMLVFKCSEQFDRTSFYKQLYSQVKNGSWLCLDKVELISVEMLSVVAQEIIDVYRTLSDKEPQIEIRGEKFPLEKNLQIFCMNNITKKNTNISGNIRNYFRLIGSCVPDFNFFVHLSLKNLGLSSVSSYAKKICFLIDYLNTKISVLKQNRICLNLFDRVLRKINFEIHKIGSENMNKFMKYAFEKTFCPFLNIEENEDLRRLMGNIFPSDGRRYTSQATIAIDKLESIVKDSLQNHNFRGEAGERYLGKLKEVYKSINDNSDFFLFVGPSLSGKSLAIDLISKFSKVLNKLQPDEYRTILMVKVFPKAFSASYMFSDNRKHSKLQFYNMYFLNQVKLLSRTNDAEGRFSSMTGPLTNASSERRLKGADHFDFENIESHEVKAVAPLKILYFDGQIDPSWIDYLNLISGPNKIHCMPNGETISMSDVKVIFETSNLVHASPSFITGCSIVNFELATYKVENILYSWLNSSPKVAVNVDLKNYIRGLFENYFPKMLEFISNNKILCFNFNENYVMKNFVNLFDSILPEFDFLDTRIGKKNTSAVAKIEIIKKAALSIFIFACAWTVSFFTNFILKTKVEKFISDNFRADDLKGPIFDYYIDDRKHDLELWSHFIESGRGLGLGFPHNSNSTSNSGGSFTYNKVFVPTVENVAYQWIVSKLLAAGNPVFYTGTPGSGKSLLLNAMLNDVSDEYYSLRYLVNFNTTSKKLEKFVLNKLYYVKREVSGDQFDRKVIFFVDDCNLERKDEFGSQTSMEALRRIVNTSVIYDMKKNLEKNLNRFHVLSCGNIMNFPKHFLSDRVIHSFCFVAQNSLSDESLVTIFKPSVELHIRQFIPSTSSITANQLVQATLNLGNYLKSSFKSSPSKLHYKFNLRDSCKIFQSVHNFVFKSETHSDYVHHLEKLWFYECARTYEDKMSKKDDKAALREETLKIFNAVYKKTYKAELFYQTSHLFAYTVGDNTTEKNNTDDNPESERTKNEGKKESPFLSEYEFLENSSSLFAKIKEKLEDYHSNMKHKHIVLNESVFDLIVKIMRVYKFNKGHLILVGPSISGKYSISQFASHLAGKHTVLLDESQLGKIKPFIKNLIIDVVYKNIPSTLFVGNFLLEKDEVLEMINNLINTREILNHIDINSNAEKDFGFKLENSEIVSRLESNLNITMCVFPQKVAYKQIFHNYPYISKHSHTIYIRKWTEQTYFELVDSTVGRESLGTLNEIFSNFGMMLYETHQFIASLAEVYSKKVMCKIKITSKNFSEMLNFYTNNVDKYREMLQARKKKYESAVGVVDRTSAMLRVLKEESEKVEPEKVELEKGIEEKKLEFNKKQVQKTQTTNLKFEEEKPLGTAEHQLMECEEKLHKNMEQFFDKVTKCAKELSKLQRNDLQQYKNYIDTHAPSKLVLVAIYSFLKENSEWDFIKKNLDPKYIQSAVNMDFSNAPAELVKFTRETVSHPDFTSAESLQKIYRITGLVTDWLSALATYFDEFDNQKDLRDEIEELTKKIAEHKKVVTSHSDNLAEISKQISEIEKDLQSKDKLRQQVINRIERIEVLKKIGEELIDGAKDKSHLWDSRRDKVNETLSNIEVYTVFLAFYVNYAAAFKEGYRNKIKQFIYRKAEELSLRDIRQKSFFDLMSDFLDVKGKDKDLLLSLGAFDDYTRENLLLLTVNGKIPYIVDNNRISKWYMTAFIQWKEAKRITFTKTYEPDFIDKVEFALRDGQHLFIEQSDEKVYHVMKDVIKDKKEYDRGRAMVMLEGSLVEVSDRSKLYFIKDRIDTKINSKIWIECLVINFIPTKEQIKSTLMKELVTFEDVNNWTVYSKTLIEFLKEEARILEVEDRIISIYNQFDYTANRDKNATNQLLLNNFKNESLQHSHFSSILEGHKIKLVKFKADFNKFSILAEDAAQVYKLMARFILLDNIYNFSFMVFGKHIKDFYKDVILTREENQKYTKEDLLLLIRYLYEKVALIYTFDHRKLLLTSLIFFYLARKSLIPNTYKQTLLVLHKLLSGKKAEEGSYNEESPVKGITKFQWNVLNEINDKCGSLLSILIEDLRANSSKWETKMIEGFYFNHGANFEMKNLDSDLELNLLTKIVFFTVIQPHKMEMMFKGFFETLFGRDFQVPKLKLTKALAQVSCKKVLVIIDDDYLSEKEIIAHYRKKYNLESNNFYRHYNLDSELTPSQLDTITNTFKNGHLMIIRNIQFARQSLLKIFEMLGDSKHIIHEAFRLVFITKSNIILSSTLYENCILINRNISKFSSIKEVISDSLEGVDLAHFDYIINRRGNALFSRKMVFHLLIVHAILKQYQNYSTGIYNNPIEFSKRDFLNCFYFISSYLNSLGEEKENTKDHSGNTTYLNIMNIALESFYCNRLVYKKETQRLMKILQRYFEEDKFQNEDYFFYFEHHESHKSVKIAKTDEANLTSEAIMQMIDDIPLEDYYDMIVNIHDEVINDKLVDTTRHTLRDFAIINSLVTKEELEAEAQVLLPSGDKAHSEEIYLHTQEDHYKKYTYQNFAAIVNNVKRRLAKVIDIAEEAAASTFKVNKNNEYVNPIDESLRLEVNSYNDYLNRIYNDFEVLNKICEGEMESQEEYYKLMTDIAKGLLPKRWKERCFHFKKGQVVLLEDWMNKLNDRLSVLRSWLLDWKLGAYCMPLFFNPRLFFYSLINYFAKVTAASPELINLKIFFTKHYTKEDLFANEAYVSELSLSNKNREIIFCTGFVLENAYLDVETMCLLAEKDEGVSDLTPVVGVTYTIHGENENGIDDEEDAEDVSDRFKQLLVPIYDREHPEKFENFEALSHIDLQYDSKLKEELWISRAVKITLDF